MPRVSRPPVILGLLALSCFVSAREQPVDGVMPGLGRSVSDDGLKSDFEYLRIAIVDDAFVYFASPGGRCPATQFRLISVISSSAVFANPEHDFPQLITYHRDGVRLVARIEGNVDGSSRSMEWTYQLVSEWGLN